MDGGDYNQTGGSPPTHLLGYYQGVSGYSLGQLVSDRSNSGLEDIGEMEAGTAPGTTMTGRDAVSNGPGIDRGSVSIWAGDLDAYMDENFLRQAIAASGWANDITRIKVVRDHYTGMHAGYGFLDAASPEAAQRVITTGSGMPIPGTNRCWRLNIGRNTATTSMTFGAESNIYVGNLEPSVTDYQLMTAFRPRYGSVRHAKVVCNEYGQSKGFGFVRFSNSAEADRAVTEMNGFIFNTKPIRLSPAAGRARGSLGGGPHFYVGRQSHSIAYHRITSHGSQTNKRPRQLMSPDDPNNTTLFIGGTASHVTEDLLWREFSTFGELHAVRVPLNKTNFAFVRFKSRNCAQRAKDEVSRTHFVSLNPNKPVRVEWASEQIPIPKLPANNLVPTYYSNTGPSVYNVGDCNPSVDPTSGCDLNRDDGGVSAIQRASTYGNFSPKQKDRAPSFKPEDRALTTGNFDCKSKLDCTRDLDTDAINDRSSSGGLQSETEPPSKRAAVGRPEYAGTSGPTSHSQEKPGAMNSPEPEPTASTLGRDNGHPNERRDVPEEAPAMQFSWLNNATTQTASSNRCQ